MTQEQWKFVMDNIEDIANHTFGPIKVHDAYLPAVMALACSHKVRLISSEWANIRVVSVGQ